MEVTLALVGGRGGARTRTVAVGIKGRFAATPGRAGVGVCVGVCARSCSRGRACGQARWRVLRAPCAVRRGRPGPRGGRFRGARAAGSRGGEGGGRRARDGGAARTRTGGAYARTHAHPAESARRSGRGMASTRAYGTSRLARPKVGGSSIIRHRTRRRSCAAPPPRSHPSSPASRSMPATARPAARTPPAPANPRRGMGERSGRPTRSTHAAEPRIVPRIAPRPSPNRGRLPASRRC